MNLKFSHLRSLKTKITFFTLVIFLISIWSLSFVASQMLQRDMQGISGEQQFSTVSFIAAGVNQELADRLKALEVVAADVSPAMLGNKKSLQAYLEQQLVFQGLFNAGAFITRTDGTAIASAPLSAKRIGVNYLDRDFIVSVLKEGKPTIGRPVIGKKLGVPVFAMTVALHGAHGKVIGTLTGVTDLSKPNFLDKITQGHYGKSGGYLLLIPSYRLIVTATDKSRIMQPLPAPGINPMVDRFLQGYEGSAIYTSPLGVEVLGSAKKIPVSDWLMGVTLPTAEAFAPIHDMLHRMLLLTIFLTLLAGALTWWLTSRMLRDQLASMLTATKNLSNLSDTAQLLQPLPVTSHDEIGELIGGFNHLLEILSKREEALQKSEMRYRNFVANLPIGIVITQDGLIKYANQATVEMIGYPEEELVGQPFMPMVCETDREWLMDLHQRRMKGEKVESTYLLNMVRKNGELRQWQGYTSTIEWNGRPSGVGTFIDISERIQMDAKLRKSEESLKESQIIAGLGSYVLDIDTGLWARSEVLDKLFGIDAACEPSVQNWIAMVHPDDRAMIEDYFRKEVLGRGQMFDKQYRIIRHNDQTTIWVHGLGKLEADTHGRFVRMHGTIQDITASKMAEEAISNLAFYDTLTMLPNRRLMMDRLRLALSVSARTNHYGAVLFLDMDKFKTLNDTLGHDYGDMLLIETAARIQSCIREVDTVARLGGDEFLILLEEVDEEAESASQKVAHIADKIRLALSAPYQLNGKEQHSSTSIGVSLYHGNEESVDSLLKHADMAMYQAKDSGRNAVRFFDPAMQLAVETRSALEADLRRAVPDRQLLLYYQMQVDNEHRPIGAEALVRWIHPELGMVSPARFIPIAEESSLILDVGCWVLNTACQQLGVWAGSKQTGQLTIAVNVSAKQFNQHDFVNTIARLLHTYQFEASRLKLELTESVVMNDVADVVTKMHALKALGVGLSMDDFGTGYSSLSYLKQLPLDQIKIDQSFVRDIATDPNDAMMVQAIIDMARNFRLNVIAEGVETEAQLAYLKQHGCMAYQGYFFSKPVPIKQFEALLERG